jgi:hypothetical protein
MSDRQISGNGSRCGENMAKKLDSNELVTFKELLMSKEDENPFLAQSGHART